MRPIDAVAREIMSLFIAKCLAKTAKDRAADCTPDDLSVGLVREIENLALEGFKQGYEYAHDEQTVKTRIPKGVLKK